MKNKSSLISNLENLGKLKVILLSTKCCLKTEVFHDEVDTPFQWRAQKLFELLLHGPHLHPKSLASATS